MERMMNSKIMSLSVEGVNAEQMIQNSLGHRPRACESPNGSSAVISQLKNLLYCLLPGSSDSKIAYSVDTWLLLGCYLVATWLILGCGSMFLNVSGLFDKRYKNRRIFNICLAGVHPPKNKRKIELRERRFHFSGPELQIPRVPLRFLVIFT